VSIIYAERKSPVLTPSSLACLSHIPTINLTAGCAIGCAYCYTRGYSSHPGEGKIVLYSNLLEKLERELAAKRVKPRAVFFSPASDLFQPVDAVLELSHKVLEFFLSRGVRVTFLTKGRIPEVTMQLLLLYPEAVHAEIGLVTLDASVAEVFEPYAAGPEERLDQMRRLVQGGIATEARVDPILPGVTDSPDSLKQLFAALFQAGIRRVAASTLFLRPAIAQSVWRAVGDRKEFASLLESYGRPQWLPMKAEHSLIEVLPQEKRRDILDRARRIAEDEGLTLSVCACKNSDIARGTCGISGLWPGPTPVSGQPRLVGLGR